MNLKESLMLGTLTEILTEALILGSCGGSRVWKMKTRSLSAGNLV